MDKVKFLQEKADLINNSKVKITEAKSLDEVYEVIETLNQSVRVFYPFISCKDKCFFCCQHTNIPSANSLEWEKIYGFLQESSEEYQNNLITNVNKFFKTHGSELKRIHNEINATEEEKENNNNRLAELSETLKKFRGNSCIFLQKGSCTIYDARPTKCRTQGFSLMKFNDNVQFQTCVPEITKFEQVLQKQGDRRVLMPVWNDYDERVYALSPEGSISTVLPVWVYSHIENEKFIPEVNLKPDFNKILEKF